MKIEKSATGLYSVRVSLVGEDGKRHWKRFSHKNRDIVRNMANDYLNSHRVYIESMAFGDASRRYLDHGDKILSPNTMRAYKSCDRELRRVYGAFCGRSVDMITSRDIQFIIDDLAARGRSPKTIANYMGYISAVMSSEGEKLPRHRMPRQHHYEPNVPDEEIVQKVAAAAKGTRYEILFALAVFGLRCGEACAVKAEDISPDNILHVRRSLATDDDGYVYEKPPKERASDRFIAIPDSLADAIREKGRATTITPKAWSCAFPHLLNKAGIPKEQRFRLHDCRHFFVSYCHDVLHLSDAQIIRLSGHQTDYVMKRVYRHAMKDTSRQVSGSLQCIIGG